MADRFELSYIYARVCGALSRSWAGERSSELLRLGRLSDIWRALFGDAAPALPEAALLAATESRVIRESLDDFKNLAYRLKKDEPFFIALRRKAEFARIKRVLLAVQGSESSCPPCDDADLPEGFDSKAYPRLEAMFRGGTRYTWIAESGLVDLPATENRLDRQFYTELWDALSTVPSRLRDGLRKLLSLEIELENVVWALRLSRYYSMRPELIKNLLIEVKGADLSSTALAGCARRHDRRAEWHGWKFEFLLADGPDPWTLDVPAIETAARRYLYRRMRLALHVNPFTYTPLYCFYRLKEFEAAVVLGVIEGTYLGAPADEMAAFALAGGVQ